MNKYSIILPVRNGGEYVKECVNSILSQLLQDFNLIVLDNCSDDGTREWIAALNHPAIIIYPSSIPLSMEDNWTRITGVSKNEFITVIGHDDLLHENYLTEMDKLIAKHPEASLYQAHFMFIDSNSSDIRPCQPMAEVQYADEFLKCQVLKTLDSMGTGYMMRSKDYDRIGGIPPAYPKLIFADYELWMRLTLKNYKATTSAECFSYRLHNSVSKLTNGEDYKNAFGKYMLFLNSIKGSEKIDAVIKKYIKKMLLDNCQSLSHRLLKTPRTLRNTSVRQFINECKGYAAMLIPGQSFKPLAKPGILAALLLDNKPGLFLFSIYKKIKK